MKAREGVLAGVRALLLLASAWAIHRTELPREDFTVNSRGCSTPITVVEPQQPARASAVLFHGLAANRRVMLLLGESLARNNRLRAFLVDLAGHGDNTDAFSFARAEECAAATVEALIRRGRIDPKQTVLVGHSLGGAIAVRLADREPVAATIAISPAPMVLPRRMPANLLVFSASYDLSVLRRQADGLALAAGGDRTGIEDFRQLRAFHLETLSLADHTSVLVDPRVVEQSADWIRGSLDALTLKSAQMTAWTDLPRATSGISFHSVVRAVAPFAGLLALLMMFPMALAVAARAARPAHSEIATVRPTRALAIAEGAALALAGVFLLKLGTPLKFLHMYSADYLVSLLAIFAALMLALNRDAAKESWSWNARQWSAAAILGFAVTLAIGAWLNWNVSDLWLNEARWMRFAIVLPFAFLFGFAEETILGPVQHGKQGTLRFAVALTLRLEIWLACVVGVYTLANGQFLIGVLVTGLAAFSILQRLSTDAIRGATGSATAAAVFGAILAAWFIAAVFPLT